MAAKLIHGENAQVTVSGITIIQDGDIELSVERDVLSKKLRGEPVVRKLPSKAVNLAGTVRGVIENSVWEDVVRPFLGISGSKIDPTVPITEVNPIEDMAVTFDFGDGGTKIKLSGCVPKSVKVSAPQDDVVSVEIEFEANGIEGA